METKVFRLSRNKTISQMIVSIITDKKEKLSDSTIKRSKWASECTISPGVRKMIL